MYSQKEFEPETSIVPNHFLSATLTLALSWLSQVEVSFSHSIGGNNLNLNLCSVLSLLSFSLQIHEWEFSADSFFSLMGDFLSLSQMNQNKLINWTFTATVDPHLGRYSHFYRTYYVLLVFINHMFEIVIHYLPLLFPSSSVKSMILFCKQPSYPAFKLFSNV